MKKFKEITPEQFDENPFKLIGVDWMLITAEKDGKVNTMTAAWGGLGVMWSKNVVFIVIRPQRYTKEFVDAASTFSLSFLEKNFKKQLGYIGSVSGRDEDKIGKSGLTVVHEGDTPFFEEANMAVICKKLYSQAYQPECFTVEGVDEEWYPDKDFHTMYIAEIEKILVKK
ncbi:MAG: flavin reductase family protein [Eubacteriaceae bacterium]|nr:flavin reductase family protein [Eubacteriaceae bacterium]